MFVLQVTLWGYRPLKSEAMIQMEPLVPCSRVLLTDDVVEREVDRSSSSRTECLTTGRRSSCR